MTDPSLIILYVNNAPTSTAFYGDLLGRKPVEQAPEFAMFALESGVMLGLWSRDTVEPAAKATGGGAELCIKVADGAAVDAAHADWRGRGLPIVQTPTDMEFGRTFVACDPDGHRLRVYAPAAG